MPLQIQRLLVLTQNLPSLLVSTDGLILLPPKIHTEADPINTDISILLVCSENAMSTVDLALSSLLTQMENWSAKEILLSGITFKAMDLTAFPIWTKPQLAQNTHQKCRLLEAVIWVFMALGEITTTDAATMMLTLPSMFLMI
jgi:hypothetical protein